MPTIDVVNPNNQVFPVRFSPKIWANLLDFWQKHDQRLASLSGVRRHWIIPLAGDPAMSIYQWQSVQSALLLAAKANPQHRDWIIHAVHEISQQVLSSRGA